MEDRQTFKTEDKNRREDKTSARHAIPALRQCQARHSAIVGGRMGAEVEMGRAGRAAVIGGVYHVYNRLARGERAFEEERYAELFVRILQEVVTRDELTVLAWCLMSNHFHLALRAGPVPLDRSMRSLQQRVTRGVNLERQVWGPLWQGRYRAKLVADHRHFDQLLLYIHLNPVVAGVVDDPAEHRWSGHRELLGRVREPISDVERVLALFGETRRSARAAYVRRLAGSLAESWIGGEPGHLPWWRLGRPSVGEDDKPGGEAREKKAPASAAPGGRWKLSAAAFLALGAEALGVPLGELQSRQRGARAVQAREMLSVLGVERYRLRVKDLAEEMRKSPDSITKAIARGARQRKDDRVYRTKLDELDAAIGMASGPATPDNGGTA
jgi:REP element-mobilizing transposase RayT